MKATIIKICKNETIWAISGQVQEDGKCVKHLEVVNYSSRKSGLAGFLAKNSIKNYTILNTRKLQDVYDFGSETQS